jgi:cytochrome c biogenesis protein
VSTLTEPQAPPEPEPPRSPLQSVLAVLRNAWRGLTSMRTALILLFLLAVAAMPGALLPQRSLNPPKVTTYIEQHGWWGELLDRLQFYNVYSSVWFSAIYVLLFVSLVGCLVPRSFSYAKQLRAEPVLTPRNLSRMPHYTGAQSDQPVAEVIEHAKRTFKGWRLIEREESGGARSISAERGILREAGNLVFHFATLGLIVAFALGAMFAYSGQVIVLANGSQFCNSGVYNYDSFTPGLQVDGTHLDPFCVKINDFHAKYLADGQPEHYESHMQYATGNDLASGTWKPYDLQVNEPLRIGGDRVYLMGNGYAPHFTVTFPNGETRTRLTQWRPDDPHTMLSSGATKFDPPGITNPEQRRKKQLAITGLFAPTAALQGKILTSVYPDLRSPGIAMDVYQGDLGTDAGTSQSIFSINQSQVQSGQLKRVKRTNVALGDQTRLPDGTKIRFDGVQRWVSLQVAHDPTQAWVLGFAVAMLLGLGTSLTIKRRRIWVRASPATGEAPVADDGTGGRTVVQVAGLARTDQAGYGEEFTRLSRRLLGEHRVQHGQVQHGKDI